MKNKINFLAILIAIFSCSLTSNTYATSTLETSLVDDCIGCELFEFDLGLGAQYKRLGIDLPAGLATNKVNAAVPYLEARARWWFMSVRGNLGYLPKVTHSSVLTINNYSTVQLMGEVNFLPWDMDLGIFAGGGIHYDYGNITRHDTETSKTTATRGYAWQIGVTYSVSEMVGVSLYGGMTYYSTDGGIDALTAGNRKDVAQNINVTLYYKFAN